MRRLVVGLAILGIAAVALSWAMADDKEIAKKITERLKSEQAAGHLQGFDINLKVAQGHVLLKGFVSSQAQQDLALEVAKQTEGVRNVVNDLEIRPPQEAVQAEPPASEPLADQAEPPAAEALADRDVAASIAQTLRDLKQSGQLKGFRISVEVKQGEAVLEGTVRSQEQKELALQAARDVAGVQSVNDHLAVVAPEQPAPAPVEAESAAPPAVDLPPDGLAQASTALGEANAPESPVGEATEAAAPALPEISDDEIAQQIARQLQQHQAAGELKGFTIDLSVENGVVVLAGTVADARQVELTLAASQNATGVKNVINQLIVAPRPAANEQVLAEQRPVDGMLASNETTAAAAAVPAASPIPTEVPHPAPALADATPPLAPEATAGPAMANFSEPSQPAPAASIAEQQAIRQAMQQSTPGSAALPASRFESAPVSQPGLGSAETVAYRRDAETARLGLEQRARDQQIGSLLMQKLERAKSAGDLQGFGISVRVGDGVVRLNGRVGSPDQQKVAVDLARRIPGVVEVINELSVVEPISTQSIATETSQRIAEQLQTSLAKQESAGKLQGCSFDVKVNQSQVILSGHVASADQQQLIQAVALQVPGVRSVQNQLSVGPARSEVVMLPGQNPAYALVSSPMPYADPATGVPMMAYNADQTPLPLGAARNMAMLGAGAMLGPTSDRSIRIPRCPWDGGK